MSFALPVEEYEFVPDKTEPEYIFASEHIYTSRRAMRMLLRTRRKHPNAVFVMCCFEAVFPDMNFFDYAICFSTELQCSDRIGRIPLIDFFSKSLFIPEESLTQHRMPRLDEKTSFCEFTFFNPKAHPMRDKLFHAINGYKRVDAQGRHLNNTGRKSDRTSANWREAILHLKAKYKFGIASENAQFPGYASEKILSSFQAGSIPVYWGNPKIAEEYNPKAFINACDFASLDELVARIKQIDADDNLWQSIASEPIMLPEQYERVRKDRTAYSKFVDNVFSQSTDLAKRIPSGYWPDLYSHWFEQTSRNVFPFFRHI